mmetsp:Transcript_14967/g.37964  ORF Transcript_14967/g.37964 Transcript_14967/m.37964 type:complete len:342 (+) Transcript_14967:97-1122(+)|eukprot:CAMPEP_0177650506 /NCGR_PEP_ID=MMETSP0447-20121125/11980_1 /TAXON_ID=0 /ORGANISM="Stygamoeba regulata, Strain BSH-02190019" /LENGTH=341 /DNA_ID=CAMNT_0019153383 /DNA_START=11 /DNA_END=1036 /DNA_ORIENTATION=+
MVAADKRPSAFEGHSIQETAKLLGGDAKLVKALRLPSESRHMVLSLMSAQSLTRSIAKVFHHPPSMDARAIMVRMRLINEADVMGKLQHPNIACVKKLYEKRGLTILEIEHAGDCDITDILAEQNLMTEQASRPIIKQVLSALCYMHDAGFVHRDVKGDNIIINKSTGKATLVDFEFACRWGAGRYLQKSVGSMQYASPEILTKKQYTGPEVDMWSLGVTLYTMVTGFFPFEGTTSSDYRRSMMRMNIDFSNLSPSLCDLLHQLLRLDPATRITASAALEHPWVTDSSTSPSPFSSAAPSPYSSAAPSPLTSTSVSPSAHLPSPFSRRRNTHTETPPVCRA